MVLFSIPLKAIIRLGKIRHNVDFSACDWSWSFFSRLAFFQLYDRPTDAIQRYARHQNLPAVPVFHPDWLQASILIPDSAASPSVSVSITACTRATYYLMLLRDMTTYEAEVESIFKLLINPVELEPLLQIEVEQDFLL